MLLELYVLIVIIKISILDLTCIAVEIWAQRDPPLGVPVQSYPVVLAS